MVCCVNFRDHVGELKANALEASDGLTELLSCGRPVGTGIKHTPCAPNAKSRNGQTRGIKPLIHNLKTTIDLTQHVAVIKTAIVEREDVVWITSMADTLISRQNFKSRRATIHNETGNTLFGSLRRHIFTRRHEHDDKISITRAANKVLGAVQNPVTVRLLHCRRFHATHIAACVRLGHRQCITLLATHSRQQPALSLLAFTSHQDVLWSAPIVAQGHGWSAQLSLKQGEFKMVKATPAHFFWEVWRIESHVDDFLADVVGDLSRDFTQTLDQVLVGVQFGFTKGTDRLNDHLLFLG